MSRWPFLRSDGVRSAGAASAGPPLERGDRAARLALGLGAPLAMAATPWWLRQGGGWGCGFQALTGLPCPLCGGTHACAALVQGDLGAAWAASPGALVLLVWLLLAAGQALAEGIGGRRRAAGGLWWHPGVLAAVGGALLLSWLARLMGLV